MSKESLTSWSFHSEEQQRSFLACGIRPQRCRTRPGYRWAQADSSKRTSKTRHLSSGRESLALLARSPLHTVSAELNHAVGFVHFMPAPRVRVQFHT
mmetsp:Transcript_23416/g.43092  ORF Transcript_23416/g.43092 Transcript_23416/m.43092 type:complete len:97 (-) Transcript_23416:28-318(-)